MHNYYELYLLLDGSISYFVEQSCYPMRSGDLILFTNQEIHKAINLTDAPFTRMVIHLNPSFIRQCCSSQTDLLACFHCHRPGIGNRISLSDSQREQFCHYFRELKTSRDHPCYGSDLHAAACIIELLLMVNRCFKQEDASSLRAAGHKVSPIMNYIDAHLTEPLSLDLIARGLSLDKYYISHLFKQETQSTIFQYILVKRIALAKQYLAEGYSVTETCYQTGFKDYCNFIRSFKNVTGFTPGAYKKQVKTSI